MASSLNEHRGDLGGSIDGRRVPEGVRYEANRLVIPPDVSYDEWETLGRFLRVLESAVRWWLGDWLAFGEHKYGQRYSQALDESDLTYSSLANSKYVSSKVPPEQRNGNLSWSHHAEVASLDHEEQRRLLEEAAREKLSVRQLRERIDEERGRVFADCPTCGGRCQVEAHGSIKYLRPVR